MIPDYIWPFRLDSLNQVRWDDRAIKKDEVRTCPSMGILPWHERRTLSPWVSEGAQHDPRLDYATQAATNPNTTSTPNSNRQPGFSCTPSVA
jgi:hypothetical protein